MPFLNRQEIALVFVCVAVMTITNTSWDTRRRRITLVAACAGVEVSHYSSMYTFLGILCAAWMMHMVARLRGRRSRSTAAHARPEPWANATATVSLGSLLVITGVTFAWGFLGTQSPGAILTDVRTSVSALFGKSPFVRSGNVNYSLPFLKTASPQQVLRDYGQAVVKIRADTPRTAYLLPQTDASTLQVQAVPEPVLPPTAIGHLLADIHIPLRGLNSALRLIVAAIEEIFLLAGLIAFLASQKLRRQVPLEYFCLSLGSVVILAIVTLLPGLSVDYGVLRLFLEALIIIAPLLVTGAIVMLKPLGGLWPSKAAAIACVGTFACATGLLPQVLGGNQPQLSLNNSGQYYNSYYVHPQEVAGVQWLGQQAGLIPAGVQATQSVGRFLLTTPSEVTGQQFIQDAFPGLLRQGTWVILDYSIVRTGIATTVYDGDVIPYKYPASILRANEDLVYDNGGIQIYR